MNRATNPTPLPRRRRIRWFAGLTLLVLALLWLLFASIVLLPRLRERHGDWPNPLQVIKHWLFPPEEFDIIVLDPTDVIEVDVGMQAPEHDPPPVEECP
jgi:hypothetical protein